MFQFITNKINRYMRDGRVLRINHVHTDHRISNLLLYLNRKIRICPKSDDDINKKLGEVSGQGLF